MRLTGNWLVAQSLVTTTLFKLLRLVFITVQHIYWQLSGTAQKLREARLPHNYERSAQVLDIVLSNNKFFHQEMVTVDNFLCTHNRFENPQYIIDNEHVTLLTFTEHDAVFCEANEKGKELPNTRCSFWKTLLHLSLPCGPILKQGIVDILVAIKNWCAAVAETDHP